MDGVVGEILEGVGPGVVIREEQLSVTSGEGYSVIFEEIKIGGSANSELFKTMAAITDIENINMEVRNGSHEVAILGQA